MHACHDGSVGIGKTEELCQPACPHYTCEMSREQTTYRVDARQSCPKRMRGTMGNSAAAKAPTASCRPAQPLEVTECLHCNDSRTTCACLPNCCSNFWVDSFLVWYETARRTISAATARTCTILCNGYELKQEGNRRASGSQRGLHLFGDSRSKGEPVPCAICSASMEMLEDCVSVMRGREPRHLHCSSSVPSTTFLRSGTRPAELKRKAKARALSIGIASPKFPHDARRNEISTREAGHCKASCGVSRCQHSPCTGHT
jgi:hypothetical protein